MFDAIKVSVIGKLILGTTVLQNAPIQMQSIGAAWTPVEMSGHVPPCMTMSKHVPVLQV